jgi:ABC-type multidrug transport system ATPase subunit
MYGLHFKLKPCRLSGGIEACIEALNLAPHRQKALRHFSSGMLQRAKLGLALFSASDVLLLDEPTSFMDEANIRFALSLIEQHQGNRTLLLASNLPHEMELAPLKVSLIQ